MYNCVYFLYTLETTSLDSLFNYGEKGDWEAKGEREPGLSFSIVQIRKLKSRDIKSLLQDFFTLMVSWQRTRNMPLNSEIGTLSTLPCFAQICLMTYNLHFWNSGNRKQKCLSCCLPHTPLASFLSQAC